MQATAPATVPALYQDAVNAARALATALNGEFAERSSEVRSLLVALVAEEHVLLLGSPGTGKTALATALFKALAARQFTVLLTKFTTPEEVFGPYSLQGLEQDQYRRVVQGYLPDAEGAVVDECYKGSSAILNSLLTILNERQFDNGGQRVQCPLKLCVGASNEMPQGDELQALHDRWALRHWVNPIANPKSLRAILARTTEPRIAVRLNPEHVQALREARELVVVPDDVVDAVMDLRAALSQQHGIEHSDRRWRKCMKLIRAHAALHGRLQASAADLMALGPALWSDREEIPAVHATVMRAVSPDLGKAQELLDAAVELYTKVDVAQPWPTETGARTERTKAVVAANSQLMQVRDALSELDGSDEVAAIAERVGGLADEVARYAARGLGLRGSMGF